jgi:hypothetical protein
MKLRTVAIVGVTSVLMTASTLVARAQSTDASGQTNTTQAPPPGPPPGPGGPGGPGGPFGRGAGGPGGPGLMGMPFGGPGGAETVTGAPYSAQAVTEITQTLADGNRIVKKVTASVSRDSAGRVRRDQVLAAVGSWIPDEQPKTTFIDDPVAHYHYILNTDKQTATRFPMMDRASFKQWKDKASSNNSSTNSATSNSSTNANASSSSNSTTSNTPPEPPHHRGPGTVTKTSLGTQTIEGVAATGTQSVLTIEAGAIGNDQPIKIVSEEWYSADLKTVVLSKRSDPRFGDTVYQLTGINRAEPDASLFQVPSNYTVTDASARQGFGGRQGRRQPPPPQN